MIAIVRLLAVLLGDMPPQEPMSRLLALDEGAFARCVRDRRSDSAGCNVPDVGDGRAHVGVSA
jgi:hypothetical protein